MKLLVTELDSTIIQTYKSLKYTQVYALRPHIYRHNFPTGSLKMQIKDMSDNLIAESEVIAIEDIGSDDFFHGYVRFEVSALLNKDQTYKFILVSGDGYSFAEGSYCGWCNGYDLGKYDPTYEPDTSFHYPLDLEVWELKKVS